MFWRASQIGMSRFAVYWIKPFDSFFARKMHSVAFVTCPDSSVANNLASLLVTKQLAACVNIVPSIESVYLWNGKLEKSSELLLIIKTRSSLMEELITTVKANHPYDCPEVISFEIQNGSPDYLNWITNSTSQLPYVYH
ncbi:unnamed protein product [Dicrocoelium dendriticum]|nr:unnamed protein product [Dicrocoelium dendriticum]